MHPVPDAKPSGEWLNAREGFQPGHQPGPSAG
jgi:hypothetical protein